MMRSLWMLTVRRASDDSLRAPPEKSPQQDFPCENRPSSCQVVSGGRAEEDQERARSRLRTRKRTRTRTEDEDEDEDEDKTMSGIGQPRGRRAQDRRVYKEEGEAHLAISS
eukprot:755024-Hanusia_phi.AAC.4